jgi:hypothetical protein
MIPWKRIRKGFVGGACLCFEREEVNERGDIGADIKICQSFFSGHRPTNSEYVLTVYDYTLYVKGFNIDASSGTSQILIMYRFYIKENKDFS